MLLYISFYSGITVCACMSVYIYLSLSIFVFNILYGKVISKVVLSEDCLLRGG